MPKRRHDRKKLIIKQSFMKFVRIFFLGALFFLKTDSFSQLLLNGDFTLGTSLWSCTPEVSIQSAYGGIGSNLVAEVDAAATLCQTVLGFIPGNSYYISVDASRRTGGCGSPAITNVDLTVAGCLSVTIVRTNTVFGWSSSAYIFTATSLIHTITFSAGAGFGGSTCGMIIDNVVVAASALPVELTSFSGEIKNDRPLLSWSTATEKNNNHFELEKSSDGLSFKTTTQIESKAKNGNSSSPLYYETTDLETNENTTYYRLKQVDHDKSFSYSKIITVNQTTSPKKLLVYPNPSKGKFILDLSFLKKNQQMQVQIFDQLGQLKFSSEFRTNDSPNYEIDAEQFLKPGYYQFVVFIDGGRTVTKILIQ
jgi:hypothetical protein